MNGSENETFIWFGGARGPREKDFVFFWMCVILDGGKGTKKKIVMGSRKIHDWEVGKT